MLTQVKREVARLETLFNKKSNTKLNLSGKVIIIDEAHNFFNSITNGSENAQKLYKAIMSSNCKLLFLTGSPIVNDPFEIALCFNMLSGTTLFPEDYSEFREFFISTREEKVRVYENGKMEKVVENKKSEDNSKSDEKSKEKSYEIVTRIHKIKNRTRFANRIVGLVSYYGADDMEIQKLLPKQLPTIVEECEMSGSQYNQYKEARKIELDVETKNYQTQAKSLTKTQVSGASYRVRSRQLCDFSFPDNALERVNDNKGRTFYKGNFDKLDPADVVKNLETYSPKMYKLFQNSKKIRGIQLIYSQFLGYGLDMIEMILREMGYEKLSVTEKASPLPGDITVIGGRSNKKKNMGKNDNMGKNIGNNKDNKDNKDNNMGKNSDMGKNIKDSSHIAAKKRYTVFTGETPKEEINDLLNILKMPENAYGDICEFVLVSSTASEGIDFRNGRAVHILESFWNYGRISQIIGRFVRIASHLDLPEKDRTVQPYIYLATQKTYNKELTSDEHIYRKAVNNRELIDSFLSAIRMSSIDCAINGYADCRTCAPTGKKLFQESLTADVQAPDPCELAGNLEIDANVKTIDGVTYAYYEENGEIVIAKKIDNGTFELLEEPEKSAIMEKIL